MIAGSFGKVRQDSAGGQKFVDSRDVEDGLNVHPGYKHWSRPTPVYTQGLTNIHFFSFITALDNTHQK